MAKNTDMTLQTFTKRTHSDDNDMFTVNGYTKTFEKCDNNSDVLCIFLGPRVDDFNADSWKDELAFKKLSSKANKLFTYWKNSCQNGDLSNKDDLIKYIQIFSLLENVFRNTLLRPYIPAYRTINTNCGRYSCFVAGNDDESLLRALNFKDTSKTLVTYEEQDSTETIVYALTCSVFWHVLSLRLKKNTEQLSKLGLNQEKK